MNFRFWRRPQPTTALPAPRPDYLAIAVLEHDEYGIQPEPGTAAALVIGLRAAAKADCSHAGVTAVPTLKQRSAGICVRCGTNMIEDQDGRWRIA